MPFSAEVTANSVILGLSLRRIVSVAPLRGLFPPSTPLTGCFPTFVPRYFFSYWIPTLLFESKSYIIFILRNPEFFFGVLSSDKFLLMRFLTKICFLCVSWCIGLLFSLMLYIVVQHYRERQLSIKATPLLTLFYRDGTVYYAVWVIISSQLPLTSYSYFVYIYSSDVDTEYLVRRTCLIPTFQC